MIILKNASGQLANKLHFLAYFITNSIEHNYNLCITCFGEYEELFQNSLSDSKNIKILNRGLLQKAINKLLNTAQTLKLSIPGLTFHSIVNNDSRNEAFDLNNSVFLHTIKNKIVVPEGWLYRDYVNLKKHQNEVRMFFTPLQPFKDVIELEAAKARIFSDIVIGVHIRRNDYLNFHGGKWYYNNDVYRN